MHAAILDPASDTIPHYGEFADPEPDASHQIVELVATGIHNITRRVASGQHYGSMKAAGPIIPGIEGVVRTADGTLVYTGFPRAPFGMLAERIPVAGGMAFPLPLDADPVTIAAGMNPGASSWMPLRQQETLGTVIVTGATGVAGQMAVANARLLGATRVIALGRSQAALDALPEGTVTVALIGEREPDAAAIRDAIGDESPSIVLDYVWGPVAETLFAALQSHGLDEVEGRTQYIQIGAAGGPDAALPASLLRARPIAIAGSGAGSASMKTLMQELPAYLDVLARGGVTLRTNVYPLEHIAEAWQDATPGVRAVVVP
jgi:NADPH:quinone reductase-like Zn-dependent oxidoreductase